MSRKGQPQHNAGNPKLVEQGKQERDTREDRRKAATREALGSPLRREWMWGLLHDLGLFESCPSVDLGVLARHQGRVDQALVIRAELKATAPDLYAEMVRENEGGVPK